MRTLYSKCGFTYKDNKLKPESLLFTATTVGTVGAVTTITTGTIVPFLGIITSITGLKIIYRMFKSGSDREKEEKVEFEVCPLDFAEEALSANAGNASTGEYDNIKKQPFLLFDYPMHQGEITTLAAAAEVDKTSLVCHIAKPLKKLVYIVLDDTCTNQQKRVEQIPSIHCITSADIKNYLDQVKGIAHADSEYWALQNILPHNYNQYMDRRQKLAKKLEAKESPKLDRLLILEMILESKFCEDADLIVLDSLKCLINSKRQKEWLYLDRITHTCRERGKSMLILYDMYRKNDLKGNIAFTKTMDLMLQLNLLGKSGIKPNRTSTLSLTVAKTQYRQDCTDCIVVRMRETGEHSVEFDVLEKTTQFNDSGLTRIESDILCILRGKSPILQEELVGALHCNRTSTRKAIKNLEDKGYLQKTNGKIWANRIPPETAETA